MKLNRPLTWIGVCLLFLTQHSLQPEEPTNTTTRKTADHDSDTIGRPVRIVSIASHGKTVEEMAEIVDREATIGSDLIVLAENWPWKKAFALDAPPFVTLAALAKKHQTYIISPVYRRDGDRVFNSSVLLDRQGKVAGIYDKVFPVLADPPGVNNEFENAGEKNGLPGQDALVFDTDFGRIGMAICFDAQFPEVWQRLEEQDAQLVLFSSAYSAGRTLGAYAMLHHYYVVSSIITGECQAYDLTGTKLLDEQKGVSRITLDLDRRMFHCNDSYNYRGQRDKLLKENPGVIVDKLMAREDYYVLKAVQPGVNLPELVKKYDLQDLRTYLRKQRQQADALRGYPFMRVGPVSESIR